MQWFYYTDNGVSISPVTVYTENKMGFGTHVHGGNLPGSLVL